MKMLAAALLLSISLTTQAASAAPSVFEEARKSIVSVSYSESYASCGGSAIDSDEVLTAFHCVQDSDGPGRLYFNRKLADYVVVKSWPDRDQVQLRVDGVTFKHFARMGPVPKPGDEAFVWGNPNGYNGLLRRGYYMGAVVGNVPWKHKATALTFDFNGYRGDSGHPIFDMQGRQVGVMAQKITDLTKPQKENPLDYDFMIFDFAVSYKMENQ